MVYTKAIFSLLRRQNIAFTSRTKVRLVVVFLQNTISVSSQKIGLYRPLSRLGD